MNNRMTRIAPTIVLATAVALVSLSACTPEAPTPAPSSSPEPTIQASTPAEPAQDPTPTSAAMSDTDYQNIAEAISSGNTAALEGYLAEPVNFILAASECCGPVSPGEAISGLDYVSGATGPWTWPVDEATLDGYRAGFYTAYFPAGVFVTQSADSDPFVVAFTVAGDEITGIFVAGGASILAG